jgi:hypothetical protein
MHWPLQGFRRYGFSGWTDQFHLALIVDNRW